LTFYLSSLPVTASYWASSYPSPAPDSDSPLSEALYGGISEYIWFSYYNLDIQRQYLRFLKREKSKTTESKDAKPLYRTSPRTETHLFQLKSSNNLSGPRITLVAVRAGRTVSCASAFFGSGMLQCERGYWLRGYWLAWPSSTICLCCWTSLILLRHKPLPN